MILPKDYDFTVGFVFEFDKNKYLLIQNLDKIYYSKSLDFSSFYKEYYGIWENEAFDDFLGIQPYIHILGYVNYSDLKSLLTIGIDLFCDYKSKPISPLFVEGMKYFLYDNFLNNLHSFKLDKKYGLLGKVNISLPVLDEIVIKIYPSKPLGEKYVLKMISELGKVFTDINFGDKSIYEDMDLVEKESELNVILSQIVLFSDLNNKSIKVTKSNYKKYLLDLQDVVLNIGGGDLETIFGEKNSIKLTKQYQNYNIEPNGQVLYMLLYIHKYINSTYLSDLISKYSSIGISPLVFVNPDIRILSYQPTYQVYKIYLSYLEHENALKLGQELDDHKIKVGDFTYIFEIYCLLNFYNYLIKIGVQFYSSISSLYSRVNKKIEKYEEGNYNGILLGILNGRTVKLCFGDKYIHSNLKTYKLFDDKRNLSFFNSMLGGVDVNGLTPDISLKIGNNLVLGDVKFSSFKSFDDNVYFPNPLIYKKLKKYRKIFVNNKLINTPIFIFYPCILTDKNIYAFDLLFDYTLYSHNFILFPVGIDNNFNHSVYNKITKIIYDLL